MGYASDTTAIISEAFEIAKRAVFLDESQKYAHWTLGIIHFYRGKRDLAIAELERAIELNPNCSLVYGTLSDFLAVVNPDESIKLFRCTYNFSNVSVKYSTPQNVR